MTSRKNGTLERLAARLQDKIIESQASNLLILEVTHSHPGKDIGIPGGFYRWGEKSLQKAGDRHLAELTEVSYKKNKVAFTIFTPFNNTITSYTSQSFAQIKAKL